MGNKLNVSKETIELLAKWVTVRDTGYMGPVPKDNRDINMCYDRRSSEYEQELGEGLEEELKMWKKDLTKNPSESIIASLKKDLPWLFEKEE